MTTESDHLIRSALEGAGRRSDQPYSSLLETTGEGGASVLESASRVRAPRISRDDVFAAADALLVEGHRPTIDRVRMRLGRGSPNTINDHLDAWWQKLGSRLRDLPGREFPQLPERVSIRLQSLWNEALEAAHESLQASLAQRDESVLERERILETLRAKLDQEVAAAQVRTAAVDEALSLARTQLSEANQRARTLEDHLHARDLALGQVRAQLDRFEAENTELTRRLEDERAGWAAERTRLQERHEVTETRWIAEVDRVRQALKTHERELRELQSRLEQGLRQRESLRAQISELKSELKTASAVREQLEARLKMALARRSKPTPSRKGGKSSRRKGQSTRRANTPAAPEATKMISRIDERS